MIHTCACVVCGRAFEYQGPNGAIQKCPHCLLAYTFDLPEPSGMGLEGHADQILRLVRELRQARDALSSLSSWLGNGLGDDSTTTKDFESRIRDGVDRIIRVETERRERAEEKVRRYEETLSWMQSQTPEDKHGNGVLEALRINVEHYDEIKKHEEAAAAGTCECECCRIARER